jgi:hypothetical protein
LENCTSFTRSFFPYMAPYPFLCLLATTGTICFHYRHETMTRTKHLIFLKRRELCRQDYLNNLNLGSLVSKSVRLVKRGQNIVFDDYKSVGINAQKYNFSGDVYHSCLGGLLRVLNFGSWSECLSSL